MVYAIGYIPGLGSPRFLEEEKHSFAVASCQLITANSSKLQISTQFNGESLPVV